MDYVAAFMHDKHTNVTWVGVLFMDGTDFFQFMHTGTSVPASLWNAGEPDHHAGGCAVLDKTRGGLSVDDCHSSHCFVCEIQL